MTRRSKFDRGHLVQVTSVRWGEYDNARRAAEAAHSYANIIPQYDRFNRDSWRKLEEFVLDLVQDSKTARGIVITGPVFRDGDPYFRGVQIPETFWKILVLDNGEGNYSVAAFALHQNLKIDGEDVNATVSDFDTIKSRVTVTQIEEWTDLNFGKLSEWDAPIGTMNREVADRAKR